MLAAGSAAGVSRVARVARMDLRECVGGVGRWGTSSSAVNSRFGAGAERERMMVSVVLDGTDWKFTRTEFSTMSKVLC